MVPVSNQTGQPHISPWSDPFRLTADDLLGEVSGQPTVIVNVLDSIRPQLDAVLSRDALRRCSKIYIVGCGDSFYAGLAVRYALERYGGLAVEPLEAMEFSRYHAEYMPPNAIVLAISNSGKAMRTVEALAQGARHGALAIAITGNDKSPLAQVAHAVLNQQVRKNGVSLTMPANLEGTQQRGFFGMANYAASLTTLYALAAHVGVQRGTLTGSEADRLRDQVRVVAGNVQQTIEAIQQPIKALAKALRDMQFNFLGAGPSYATALFFAAKTFELPRVNGVAQQLEEWAHEQYFLAGPNVAAVFIAPPGRGQSRVLELLQVARRFGVTTVAVTEAGSAAAQRADHTVVMAGQTPEEFSPLVYCVPSQLFAIYLAEERGRPAFAFDSALQKEINESSIQQSELWKGEEAKVGV